MALMVSVSGVRGLVGQTLTPALALEFAHAYATVLGGGEMILARDTRPSGEMYAAAATAGMLAAGCRVVNLGVAMTPTAGFAIRERRAAGGIILTASHNPAEWNGLKFLDENGLAPDPALVTRIADIRARGAYRQVASGFHPVVRDEAATDRHVAAVLAAVETDIAPLRGMRVVVDSINGAGCRAAPAVLRGLGVEPVQINGTPDGAFAHTPEPIAENLSQLCEAVRRERAAIGFAQDPDADRLAIVDEQGRFIGEEYTLALAVQFVLSQRRGPVAANLSTSRMIDDLAARAEVPVLRTPVGEAHVARAMMQAGAVIGGEGNGGVIDLRISPVRDSILSIALVLQLMARTGRSVSALVAELPRYAMIKQKFAADRDRILAAVERLKADAARRSDLRIDDSDGVRLDFDAGWVHLRPSNTEPIVRVIAEAADESVAQRLIDDARRAAGI
ncbi:MAG: phosphoglucosamine mutase [Planctomycetia bacterium]|nr:MAG: phosphoglucosamine mutase [Planctomycetia bacterium]